MRPAPEDLIPGGQKHYLLADGSILAQGYAPTKDITEIRVKTKLPHITAFRLELLNDPNLPLERSRALDQGGMRSPNLR